MSLGFADAEFFEDQNLGIAPSLDPPSSSSIAPPSSILSETFKLDDPKYTTTPLAYSTLLSADHPFTWGEMTPTDGVAPAQTTLDPSMLLIQEFMQKSATHSPTIFPSGDSSSFVMTCPLPLCSHQSSELISIWRHITWDHLGDTNKYSKSMTELVEKVVLGAEEK